MTPPTKTSSLRKPAGKYHHGDLRRALLDGALQLVQEAGPHGLTLRGAARLAGVSAAAPYRHFQDRLDMLSALAEQGFGLLLTRLQQAAAEHTDPLAQAEALGVAYVVFASEHTAYFRVMFSSELSEAQAKGKLSKAGKQTFSLLQQALEASQAAGYPMPGTPQELALTAWSLVHGAAHLVVDGHVGGGDVTKLAQSLVGTMAKGFRGPSRELGPALARGWRKRTGEYRGAGRQG